MRRSDQLAIRQRYDGENRFWASVAVPECVKTQSEPFEVLRACLSFTKERRFIAQYGLTSNPSNLPSYPGLEIATATPAIDDRLFFFAFLAQ